MKKLTYILIAMILIIAILIGFTTSLYLRLKNATKIDLPEELTPYLKDTKDTLNMKCYFDKESNTIIFNFND